MCAFDLMTKTGARLTMSRCILLTLQGPAAARIYNWGGGGGGGKIYYTLPEAVHRGV